MNNRMKKLMKIWKILKQKITIKNKKSFKKKNKNKKT